MGGDEASTCLIFCICFLQSFSELVPAACLFSNLQIRNAAKVVTNLLCAPKWTMFCVVLPGLVVILGFQTPIMTLETKDLSPPRVGEELLSLPFTFLFPFVL